METRSCSRKRKSPTSGENDDSIEAKLEEPTSEAEKLQQTIEKQNATIIDLATSNTQLKNENDINKKIKEDFEKLKKVEAELQSKLAETQIQKEKETKNFEEKLADLKFIVDARDNECKELKEQIFVLQKVKVELGTTNDEFKEKLENQRKTFGDKINEMQATINNLTEKDGLWKDKSEELRKMVTKRENDISKLKKQFFDREKEKLRLIARNADIEKKLENDKNKYEAEIVKLTKEKSALELKVANVQKAAEEYKKKSEEMEGERQKASDALIEFKTKLEKLEHDFNIVQEQTALRYLEIKDIHDGPTIYYDHLDSRTVLNVEKFKSSSKDSWKFYSTEDEPAFKIGLGEIFKRSQFRLNLNGIFICKDGQNKRRIQEIIPRLYSCTIKELNLCFQILDEYDFIKLVSSNTIKICKLREVSIKKSNEVLIKKSSRKSVDGIMGIEEILMELSNLEIFEYYFKFYNEITSQTSKYLSQLPRFESLKEFKLYNCSRNFNLGYFRRFLMKHEGVNFVLHYRHYGPTIQARITRTAQDLADLKVVFPKSRYLKDEDAIECL